LKEQQKAVPFVGCLLSSASRSFQSCPPIRIPIHLWFDYR